MAGREAHLAGESEYTSKHCSRLKEALRWFYIVKFDSDIQYFQISLILLPSLVYRIIDQKRRWLQEYRDRVETSLSCTPISKRW